MSEDGNDGLDSFVQELTSSQGRIRAFILASLGNYADTADVLQRTNLVIWKKAGEFHKGASFMPWALAIARFEVLAFLRDSRRDRHVFASDVAEMMLDMATQEVSDLNDRNLALRRCLEKVPRHNRDLLWRRYGEEKSIRQMAMETNRTEDSLKSLFLRIRKRLERCVEGQLR